MEVKKSVDISSFRIIEKFDLADKDHLKEALNFIDGKSAFINGKQITSQAGKDLIFEIARKVLEERIERIKK
jgi:hypothetical protein